MSTLSSGGDNASEAFVSSSADERGSISTSDDPSGSGQASVQESPGASREELSTEKGDDGSIKLSSHDGKEIDEPHSKADGEPPPKPGKHKSQAALRLQKVYRSFRTRRQLADCAVIVEQKWWKVLDLAELKRSSISFFDYDKHESVLSKWSRARTRAAKVGKGLSKDEKARKLALQHWLEAIDPRHRYGHNLQFYYVKWLHCESTQPFFYWLDIGEGKDTDLERCSRLKLQQQCIKYLGPTEREDYQVVVEKGRFIYKKSGTVLDTTNSPKGTKWIFVLCTSKALYVGQKVKGHFQHSSFLAGGATLSAGRLVVEDGYLKAVWPHSGHYLPTEENFHAFMAFLMEHNVDLTHVQKSPMEEEEENHCLKEMALMAQNQLKKEPSEKNTEIQDDNQTETQPGGGGEGEEEKEQIAPSPTLHGLEHPTLPKLKIPSKGDDALHSTPPFTADQFHDVPTLPDDSSSSGYETAEDSLISEVDFIHPKMNIFDDEEKEEFKDAIPHEMIQRRINTHRRTKSYQLAEQLSFKWTTGVGPRIGCLRDYPSKLQFQAMEHVNLSPRSVKCLNSPGTAALGIKRDLFKMKSPLGGSMPFPSPLGSALEFATPPSADVTKKDPFEE